jgi:hypothetical protein
LRRSRLRRDAVARRVLNVASAVAAVLKNFWLGRGMSKSGWPLLLGLLGTSGRCLGGLGSHGFPFGPRVDGLLLTREPSALALLGGSCRAGGGFALLFLGMAGGNRFRVGQALADSRGGSGATCRRPLFGGTGLAGVGSFFWWTNWCAFVVDGVFASFRVTLNRVVLAVFNVGDMTRVSLGGTHDDGCELTALYREE